MDVNANARPLRLPSDVDLYTRTLDKILRDTEDGELLWRVRDAQAIDREGNYDRYTMYASTTSDGTLLLHGYDESARGYEAAADPVGFAATQKGEARLYLVDEKGRKGPFPPAGRGAFQSALDNLLTAVRLRTETPEAEAFARRFLGEE